MNYCEMTKKNMKNVKDYKNEHEYNINIEYCNTLCSLVVLHMIKSRRSHQASALKHHNSMTLPNGFFFKFVLSISVRIFIDYFVPLLYIQQRLIDCSINMFSRSISLAFLIFYFCVVCWACFLHQCVFGLIGRIGILNWGFFWWILIEAKWVSFQRQKCF